MIAKGIHFLTTLCFCVLLAHSQSPQGRWFFEAINDTGKHIPLLIIEIAVEGAAPEAKILSTSAPFEIRVDALEVSDETFQLRLKSNEGQLTLRGSREGTGIEGTIRGFAFNNYRFVANQTELSTLQQLKEPTKEELQDFRNATRISESHARVEAFREFMTRYPESALRGQAAVHIFGGLVETTASDEELLSAAETTVRVSDDKVKAMDEVAYALARQKRLLGHAETYARKSVETIRQNSPSYGTSLHTLGWVLFQQGRTREAVEYLTRAFQFARDRRELTVHLAQALEVEGDGQHARDLYLRSYVTDANADALEKARALHRGEHGSMEGFHDAIDREYEKRASLFEPGKYEGKIGDKVVLAELFTGAECGPCQAADFAFHALQKHYPDSVVAILKYHLHVPGPDPMTNLDAEQRANYYGVLGTPDAVVDGVGRRKGGGFAPVTINLFTDYQNMIQEQTGQKPQVKLDLVGTREKDLVRAKVKVILEDDDAPLQNLRLRLALVEGTVHYTGLNQVHFHKQVVRKLLGGAEGLPLIQGSKKSLDHELTQDLNQLETELEGYLKSFQEQHGYQFRDLTYKIDRANVALLAFVQDDEKKTVLNAKIVQLD